MVNTSDSLPQKIWKPESCERYIVIILKKDTLRVLLKECYEEYKSTFATNCLWMTVSVNSVLAGCSLQFRKNSRGKFQR